MPLYKIITINDQTTAYFWQITEAISDLFKAVSLKDTSLFRLEKMKSESHQKGFLAVRMLLQHIGYTDYDLHYDAFGKPHLKSVSNPNDTFFISISHSHSFSCICISKEQIGIDIEILKDKTLKIASRFLDVKHLEALSKGDQIKKATVIWGVKEAIFKIKNEKGISFPEHIFEDEFHLNDGNCSAQLHFNNQISFYKIFFYSLENYIFVCAFENN